MKSQRNIFVAFLLNFAFSVFEMIGGAITGSVAIVSDAVHDLADAASIGLSWYLERKSKRQEAQARAPPLRPALVLPEPFASI